MKTKKYNWALYLISFTILVTIVVQFYWNYKNYEENKQRILNEIQLSLDNSVEQYYTELSKKNFITIVESDDHFLNSTSKGNFIIPLKDTIKNFNYRFQSIDLKANPKNDLENTQVNFIDSILVELQNDLNSHKHNSFPSIKGFTQLSSTDDVGIHIDATDNTINSVNVFRGKKAADSLKLIKGLQTIFVALKNDSIVYPKLDSLLKKELLQKKINIKYAFKQFRNDTLYNLYDLNKLIKKSFSIKAKSTYFLPLQQLELNHTNPTFETLKRSSAGILLSLLLSLAVISSLFYLLKVITQQKQLAEIKNDLISNITHEFKTPIATVSTAIEAMQNFNLNNDKEKTKKYLGISSIQLKKLHGMVEKLLETATLDSEKLLLNKEYTDIISLIERIVNKYKLVAPSKDLNFSSNTRELTISIDPFHFENAVSNLIDNAVKYGGNTIDISVTSVLNTIDIIVADNGNGINRAQLDKIFDKFYRVPKGNVHDVKGFGIGLYYTKKIIEKHKGMVSVSSKPNNTIFKISLPDE